MTYPVIRFLSYSHKRCFKQEDQFVGINVFYWYANKVLNQYFYQCKPLWTGGIQSGYNKRL